MKPMLNSFNGGELSPLLDGRIDIDKYASGCRVLENMIPRPQGAAERRPGTIHVEAVKFNDKAVRLIPFVFSDEQAYILEFGENYIRFYYGNSAVNIDRRMSLVSRPGDLGNLLATPFYIGRYELLSPYSESDLADIQYVQSADVMYMVHPGHPPRKLSRFGYNNWLLEEIDFTDGPFGDENITDIPVKCSATSGEDLILQAYWPLFTEDMVGSLFKIKHIKEETSLNGSLSANGSSATLEVSGKWDFTTHGNWGGKVIIQRKFPEDDDWQPYRTYTSHWDAANSTGDRNVQASGDETEDDASYRITMEDYEGGTCHYDMSSFDYIHEGVVRVTGFDSSTGLRVDTVKSLASTEWTKRWHEGAWSDKNGYPRAICFYQERLCFGGTAARPVTVWLSKVDDYEKMDAGTNDDDAMATTLSVAKQNRIQWMEDAKKIFIGTAGSEHTLGPSSSSEAISATNIQAERNDTKGSASMQAVLVNNAILYLQKNRRIISEFVYSWESDSFVTADMTVLAEHITESGVIDMAFQRRPDPILWCVRADGQLCAMTYMREQGVVAWHRHILGGDGIVESVAVIPGATEDQIWVSVKRTINGSVVRYIEYFSGRDFGSDQGDCHFVDAALVWPPRTVTLEGIEPAQGQPV